MFKLSQETIAIVTVGLTLLGSSLYATARIEDRIRDEVQALRVEIQSVRVEGSADRRTIREEARADREAIRAEGHADREAIRAEGRADREAIRAEARADREAFEKHIIRLTQEQGRIAGVVEQMHTAAR